MAEPMTVQHEQRTMSAETAITMICVVDKDVFLPVSSGDISDIVFLPFHVGSTLSTVLLYLLEAKPQRSAHCQVDKAAGPW